MNTNVIFEGFPVLESDRLILKKIETCHLEDVYEIFNNEHVFTYCGILPKHNKETVKKMIEHFERDYLNKKRIKWGIFTKKEDKKLVGIIEAFDFNRKIGMVTIGYYLAEANWGKGIATEAVRILNKFLFEDAEINRIQAEVMPQNDYSKKILLKNGFRKEGTLRQATVWTGKGIIDLEIYGHLKKEYEELINTKEKNMYSL